MVWPRIRNIVHGQTAALFFAFAIWLVGCGAPAQSANPYTPQIGQPGKDVIWVPTSERAAERMLTMAKVGPSDFVIDLGSGDGRIVIMAAQRFGARGFGLDLNSNLVKLSEYRAAEARVSDQIEGEIAVSEGSRRLRWVATRMKFKEGNDG